MGVETVSMDSSSVTYERKRIDGKGREGKGREKRETGVDRRTWGQRIFIKKHFKIFMVLRHVCIVDRKK